MENFSQPAFCVIFLVVFVPFFKGKNWCDRGFIVTINICSTFIKLLRW